ncbi:MAG: hypothetical protein AB1498_06610 [bacterium]
MNVISKFRNVLTVLVVIVLCSSACSKREDNVTQSTQEANADTYLTQATDILKSIGAEMSFTNIAQLSGTSAGSMENLFSQGNTAGGFDSTKLSKLSEAIGLMQTSLTQLGSPKKPMLAPGLASDSTLTDSDKLSRTYIHLYLAFLYTLDAAMRLRYYVGADFINFTNGRYELNVSYSNTDLLSQQTRVQALLDAWFMLNGQVGHIGTVYANSNLPAGTGKCAFYHFGKAIYYGILLFTNSQNIQDALYALHDEREGSATKGQGKFDLFFSDMSSKMQNLGMQ